MRREAAAAKKDGTLVKGEGQETATARPNQASRAKVRAEAASAAKAGQGPDMKR